MAALRIEEHEAGIRVASEFWEIEHLKRAGGAWGSLVFKHGSGKNLLRNPLSSGIRFQRSDAAGSGEASGYFSEGNEPNPKLNVEQFGDGSAAVTAEGTFRNSDGEAVPVGYRRRTEYRAHGVIWTTLQLMSECGCGGAVEIRGFDLPLRAGLTDAYVRFHPTQAGGADLLGGRAWLDLKKNTAPTPFLSRFTPLQIACFERGVEGIEIFSGSELAQWDCAFKPDIGLGLYRIGHDASGASLELGPYCLTQRRLKVRVQGNISLRLGITLPEVKPRAEANAAIKHAFLNSNWRSEEQIEQLAAEGVGLICFKDDYRDGTTFWRNGAVTPYDAGGMTELRRTIETCQRCGIKIVPYIAAHELHPETHAYELHARGWMHSAARSLDVIHAWSGTGDIGGLMCLRSGWLDYRKQTIDAILNGLPWDGLCLDWPSPMPCAHPDHAAAPFHSDVEELHELLSFCRKRVGAKGTLAFLAAGDSSILAANLADHILPRGE